MTVNERIQRELAKRLRAHDASASHPPQKRDDARTDRRSVAESIQRELDGEANPSENSENAPVGNSPQKRGVPQSAGQTRATLAAELFLDQERKTPAYKKLTRTQRLVFEKSVREQLQSSPTTESKRGAKLGDGVEDLRSGVRRQAAIVTTALTKARAVR